MSDLFGADTCPFPVGRRARAQYFYALGDRAQIGSEVRAHYYRLAAEAQQASNRKIESVEEARARRDRRRMAVKVTA